MIKFKLEKGVELPKFETPQASGADVVANTIIKSFSGDKEANEAKIATIIKGFERCGYIKLRPFERILFGTGITVADMPSNLELQVRSRSGMSLKKGLFVANQPGTIDSDYRGEIGVILYNSSSKLVKVSKGDRIAQIVPKEKTTVEFQEAAEITETQRGEGGFGSTGEN